VHHRVVVTYTEALGGFGHQGYGDGYDEEYGYY
jgi:hypothetical protein